MNYTYAATLAGFTDRATLEWLHENATNNCFEIGTYGGRSAYAIASSRSATSLTCIDTWQDYLNVHKVSILGKSEGFPSFQRLLKDHPELPIHFHESSSLEPKLLSSIPDRSIDFLFVDGDHTYAHVCNELRLWHPKVATHGRIVVDDIQFVTVKQAVREFVQSSEGLTVTRITGTTLAAILVS